MRVYDLDGEQLSLDTENGELHREGDSAKERVPHAASWPLAAGLRGSKPGEKRALDSGIGGKPSSESLVVPSLPEVTYLTAHSNTCWHMTTVICDSCHILTRIVVQAEHKGGPLDGSSRKHSSSRTSAKR